MESKQCSSCRTNKDIINFLKGEKYLKTCNSRREYQSNNWKEYRSNNKELFNKYKRKYRSKNLEAVREYQRNYYHAHKAHA